jgi:hypothetical protein
MARFDSSAPDEGDGVQYDTFYAPDGQQLEREEIRLACLAEERARASRPDAVTVTRPY